MSDIKLFNKCRGCSKKKFLTRKFDLSVSQMKQLVHSRDYFCSFCIKGIRAKLSEGINHG